MTRSALVVLVAAALVLSFAATASGEPNGNVYIQWSTAAPNNVVPSPHAGYTTATRKCAVCHAVHYAASSGYAWTDSPSGANAWTADSTESQMLLRSNVANACNYCHILTSIGGVQIYGGQVSLYTDESNFAHNGTSAPCSGCHAVHGERTFKGANEGKVLRIRADRPIQPEVIGAAGGNPAIAPVFAGQAAAVSSLDKYQQQIAFCSQCHATYADASESTITGGPGFYNPVSGTYSGEYHGHPLKSAEATFSAPGATFTNQVSWVGSNTCRACHDAGGVDQTGVTFNSFPHYTQGYAYFASFGAEVGSQDASSSTRTDSTDGNCLKCHVNTGAAEGVGITY